MARKSSGGSGLGIWPWLGLALVIVIIDQFTKTLILGYYAWGDTTVVTLHAEVLVDEKRLRATEEVRITRRTSTRHAEERVTLRREEAVVERLDAAEAGDGDPE